MPSDSIRQPSSTQRRAWAALPGRMAHGTLLARAARDLDDRRVTSGVRPTALVVLEQRLRSDAADTLRYFADQNVHAKVISGDNAVSVGAVAGKLGIAGKVLDARRLPSNQAEMVGSRRAEPSQAYARRLWPS